MEQIGFGVRVLLTALVFSATAHAVRAEDTSNCALPRQPSMYIPLATDHSDSTSFFASRPFAGVHSLSINVCAGNLHIVPSTQPGRIVLSITSPGANRPLGQFVEAMQTAEGHAVLSVRVPSKYHPSITLGIPGADGYSTDVKLGEGDLLVERGVLTGDRKLSVGAGKVQLMANPSDYATLVTDVGMGELKDDRPAGKNSYFAVDKQARGTGTGNIQVTVGAGDIVLKPASP